MMKQLVIGVLIGIGGLSSVQFLTQSHPVSCQQVADILTQQEAREQERAQKERDFLTNRGQSPKLIPFQERGL